MLRCSFLYFSYLKFKTTLDSSRFQGRGRNGQTVVIDDFREAYWWLRDHTPEDR